MGDLGNILGQNAFGDQRRAMEARQANQPSWWTQCVFWGGAKGERESLETTAWIMGKGDHFACARGKRGNKVIAQGALIGWVRVRGDALLAYARAHPDVPQAQRLAAVVDRGELSPASLAAEEFIVVAARLEGDRGFPPDGTRWLAFSGVSNSDKWERGSGSSPAFSAFVNHLASGAGAGAGAGAGGADTDSVTTFPAVAAPGRSQEFSPALVRFFAFVAESGPIPESANADDWQRWLDAVDDRVRSLPRHDNTWLFTD